MCLLCTKALSTLMYRKHHISRGFHSFCSFRQSGIQDFSCHWLLSLTHCLLHLESHCIVTSSSIFNHHFYAKCSFKLANCMLPFLLWPNCTRLSTHVNPYSIQTPHTRVNKYLFFHFLYWSALELLSCICIASFL